MSETQTTSQKFEAAIALIPDVETRMEVAATMVLSDIFELAKVVCSRDIPLEAKRQVLLAKAQEVPQYQTDLEPLFEIAMQDFWSRMARYAEEQRALKTQSAAVPHENE